jgi:hypothetical protein
MAVKRRPADNKPPIPMTSVELLPEVLATVFWGRSGTGKTTCASTFPKPLLLLDVREKGTDSISNVKGVKVGEITSWADFEAVYWYLEKGNHDFKTVVVDQITTLQDLAMDAARKELGDTRDPRRLFGHAGGLMKTWLLNYRDLIEKGIHVVFIAHDRVNKGEEGAGDDQLEPEAGPRVMPSVATFLNGSVKIIGNSFIRENYTIENKRKVRHVEYGMRIGPHAYYTTKARSPVGIAVPEAIVDPTYEKLLAVLRGDYSEKPSTVRRK